MQFWYIGSVKITIVSISERLNYQRLQMSCTPCVFDVVYGRLHQHVLAVCECSSRTRFISLSLSRLLLWLSSLSTTSHVCLLFVTTSHVCLLSSNVQSVLLLFSSILSNPNQLWTILSSLCVTDECIKIHVTAVHVHTLYIDICSLYNFMLFLCCLHFEL